MIPVSRIRAIWLALHKVDFRCAQDGLLAEAYGLKLNPFKGDAIIFIGRCRRRIKILYADETGLWVSSKRFTEAIKTKLRFLTDPKCSEISMAELAMILEGASYRIEKKMTPWSYPTSNS